MQNSRFLVWISLDHQCFSLKMFWSRTGILGKRWRVGIHVKFSRKIKGFMIRFLFLSLSHFKHDWKFFEFHIFFFLKVHMEIELIFLISPDGFWKFQVLQQCLLCKSWRNKHKRDEFSWGGFPVWFGLWPECDTHHISHLLLLPPKRDVAAISSKLTRPPFIFELSKIIQAAFAFQWRWALPSQATTCCLIQASMIKPLLTLCKPP